MKARPCGLVVISGVFQGRQPGSIPQSGVKKACYCQKKKKKERLIDGLFALAK
jgi:hypothetical protein